MHRLLGSAGASPFETHRCAMLLRVRSKVVLYLSAIIFAMHLAESLLDSRRMGTELFTIKLIGTIGAVLTTICWAPQAWRVIQHRNTHAISLLASATMFAGQICWLVYGLALNDWPLIGSNAISIMFTTVILTMKVRYG